MNDPFIRKLIFLAALALTLSIVLAQWAAGNISRGQTGMFVLVLFALGVALTERNKTQR